MNCEKDCYFCRNLCFLDVKNPDKFYCTISGLPYQKTKLSEDCNNFVPDMEE